MSDDELALLDAFFRGDWKSIPATTITVYNIAPPEDVS